MQHGKFSLSLHCNAVGNGDYYDDWFSRSVPASQLLYDLHWLPIGSRAVSFKRPLLSVDVSMCVWVWVCVCVCLSATLMLNISETKRFRDSCPVENLPESACGDWWCHPWRHMMSWCHTCDVTTFKSRRIRKLGPSSTIRVDPLNTHWGLS